LYTLLGTAQTQGMVICLSESSSAWLTQKKCLLEEPQHCAPSPEIKGHHQHDCHDLELTQSEALYRNAQEIEPLPHESKPSLLFLTKQKQKKPNISEVTCLFDRLIPSSIHVSIYSTVLII
jgi:hypothetical protein